MDLREILKAHGLSDEQINKILASMNENRLYTTTEENADIRIKKFKEQKEQLENDLKEANKTIETIKKGNKGNEELQTKIADYEKKLADLEAERLKERKDFILITAIKDAGGLDEDYLIYKLGELELDKNGEIPNLENKIKDLKANHAHLFKGKEGEKGKIPPNGYEPIPNPLDKGAPAKTFTVEEVKKMTPAEINANWEIIKKMDLSK